MTDWTSRISFDSDICHGKACIRGTRVLVSVILDHLAEGATANEIANDFQISHEDIAAVLAYAADLARDRILPLPKTG